MFQMKMNFFTDDEEFPFFIQHGEHKTNLFLHGHENYYELVIVLKGDAIHLVNDEQFYISKGDVFVIGGDTLHGYHKPHDFEICNVMFQPDFFFTEKKDLKEMVGFQELFVIEPILAKQNHFSNRLKLDVYHFEMVQKLIDFMVWEYLQKGEGYKSLITGCFYGLCVQLCRLYSEMGEAEDGKNDVLGMAKSISYIESHYTESLTVEHLATIAGFSTRHYSRRFFEIKETTPVQYLQSVRLEKACYYLSSTDLPIAWIANQCGFSDSNYFSRVFKKWYGVSPSKWRKNEYYTQ